MTFLRMEDFKRPDGSVDWSAMRAAERAAGHRCRDCDDLILWPDPRNGKCTECQALDEPAEAWHSEQVRCPHCGERHHVRDWSSGRLHEEGTHEVFCSECEKDFEIETMVTWEFKSPARSR